MTINTKDIEAGDIVTWRNGSKVVAYLDKTDETFLGGWSVAAWRQDGYLKSEKNPHPIDIIAIEKKPEDVIVRYVPVCANFKEANWCRVRDEAPASKDKVMGKNGSEIPVLFWLKITLNLTDKTKNKIEEVV